MEYEIVEKAWVVNKNKFSEPWNHGDEIYYGTKGSVKEMAIIDNYEGELLSGDDLTFLTIPIIRSKNNDKILFNGTVLKRWEVLSKERKLKINNLDKEKTYYIQDARSYVGNAVLWWGLNGCGYVTDLSKAHKYTWEELRDFEPRDTDIIWESEHVEKAVRKYLDMQGLNRLNSI
jgi:hypothetical protein